MDESPDQVSEGGIILLASYNSLAEAQKDLDEAANQSEQLGLPTYTVEEIDVTDDTQKLKEEELEGKISISFV